MDYPEKLYVELGISDWSYAEQVSEDNAQYHAYPKIEAHAELNREVEVAVYQYVGKIKLINKTVLAEPDAP